jgi:predicted exporter
LELSERVTAELQRLVSQHLLAGFQSPVAFLPSVATQKQRQDAIPPRAELAARLERAAMTMPFRPGTFAPFLQDAESARTQALIGRENLTGTSFGLLTGTLLMRHGETWQALFPLRGVAAPDGIAEAIAQAGIPGTLFLDIKRDSDAFYGAYRQQAVLLSLGGVLTILLLLGASLRSLRRVAAVAVPLAAAVLIASAILVLSGQRLTIFHLIGLLLTVAAGSNYSLFFERDREAGEAHEWVVASLALANLCTVIGFGILSFSQIPVLHGIGMTVACGTVLSLAFSAILSKTIARNDAAMMTALKG